VGEIGPCLDENVLAELLDESTPRTEHAAELAHLDACARCRGLLHELAVADSFAELFVGRYELGERIGAGAMSIVYAAYDPQLRRTIAIKLLRHERRAPDALRARLQREAHVLAKLSHPNIVPLYDIGEVGDDLFLAMERVEGGTLRQWLAAAHRDKDEILRTFAEAGAGLAAAHRAGVVHRDFKPDNVLVGKEGRARVADFGLAAETADPTPSMGTELPVDATASGFVVGTPAYMAPEQRAGAPATALSDQYSFCVALHEALHGTRPPDAPRASSIRPSIRRALEKGLSPAPEQRHASMEALLAALAPRRARSAWAWIAAGVGAASLLAIFFATSSRCDGGAAWRGVWDDAARNAVRRAFHAAPQAYVRALAEPFVLHFDRYRAAWIDDYAEACRAEHKGLFARADAKPARLLCLDQRRQEVGAAARILAGSTPEQLMETARALPAFSPLDPCRNLVELSELPPVPIAQRAAVAHARAQLAVSHAEQVLGHYADAARVLEALEPDVNATGYAPVQAELLYERGITREGLGEREKAQADLFACVDRAEGAHMDTLRARALVELVACAERDTDQRLREADHLVQLTEGVLHRLGTPALALEGRFLDLSGSVAKREGDYARAEVTLRRAQTLLRGSGDELAEQRAQTLTSLGEVVQLRGRYAEALALKQEALACAERVLDASNPRLALYLHDVGVALASLNRHADALPYFDRAIALEESAAGAQNADLAVFYDARAISLMALTRREAGLADFERALAVRKRSLPADHSDLLLSYYNLAAANEALARCARARDYCAQSIAIAERIYGSADPRVASYLTELGEIELACNAPERARAVLERALRIDRPGPGSVRHDAEALLARARKNPRSK
jgi:serine/threonine protein kinase